MASCWMSYGTFCTKRSTQEAADAGSWIFRRKVEQIFASQLSEEEFRCHCKVVIDNSADLGDTYRQIDERLKEAGLSR